MATIDYKEKYEKAVQAAMLAKQDTESAVTVQTLEEIFPELRESGDERVKNEIISAIKEDWPGHTDWIDWLEKQGEHANFRNKIQIGDKVTRNEDGVLVNLSQLNRVAKKDEKQGEQKPAEFDDTDAKRMFIKALECVEEQNAKGYKLTDCDKNSWWEDFKAYTTSKQILANSAKTCKDEQKPAGNKGMNLVEEEMTPFQKKVFCIIDTTIEEEQGLKQVCDELFALASNEIKQESAEWSEEGKLSNK